MPICIHFALRDIGDCLRGCAEHSRGRDPPHGQAEEEQDERFLSRRGREDDAEFLDPIGVDADVVKTILDVHFGKVHRAPCWIVTVDLVQQPSESVAKLHGLRMGEVDCVGVDT